MAHSNVDSIEIREKIAEDGRRQLKIRELYVDGCHRATVEQQRGGSVKFRFYPIGAFDWQEAKVWLQGLLELSIHAEELTNGKK